MRARSILKHVLQALKLQKDFAVNLKSCRILCPDVLYTEC